MTLETQGQIDTSLSSALDTFRDIRAYNDGRSGMVQGELKPPYLFPFRPSFLDILQLAPAEDDRSRSCDREIWIGLQQKREHGYQ